ncbi:MAG: hypothetical protein P4L27_06560 [Ignavibacteriaceae bacterium]|nr:hypothetical protein [Ignavibacteriaceae bacterium]
MHEPEKPGYLIGCVFLNIIEPELISPLKFPRIKMIISILSLALHTHRIPAEYPQILFFPLKSSLSPLPNVVYIAVSLDGVYRRKRL